MIEVDVRGFACPIPVVRTQKAMAENPGQEIVVLYDCNVAKENVRRLAESKGYAITENNKGEDFSLLLKP
jgi:tRNA 2-thiouridine synthesizing protein A